MINLPVDESAAFDALSILYVKQERGLPVYGSLDTVKAYIRDQITTGLFVEILDSVEFQELMSANRITFHFVKMAHDDSVKASEVDAANQRRYTAKKALQERFWPDQPLTEVKAERPLQKGSLALKAGIAT